MIIYRKISQDDFALRCDGKGAYEVLYDYKTDYRDPDEPSLGIAPLAMVKAYMVDREYHNATGPAVLCYKEEPSYYLNGRFYKRDEWFKRITADDLAAALGNPINFIDWDEQYKLNPHSFLPLVENA